MQCLVWSLTEEFEERSIAAHDISAVLIAPSTSGSIKLRGDVVIAAFTFTIYDFRRQPQT